MSSLHDMHATDDVDSYGRTPAEIDAILAHTDAAHESRMDEAVRFHALRERVRVRYGPAPATRVVVAERQPVPAMGPDSVPPRSQPAPSTPRREPLPAPVSDLEAGARLMDAELARIVGRLWRRLAAAIAGRPGRVA